jgi:hypothetical protein
MLNDDKTLLIMAKTDQMNGIQTNLNMYNEQLSMLSKETNIALVDVSDEKLMLEKLKAEKIIMEKELNSVITEKNRIIIDAKTQKVITESESDKAIIESKRNLI